MLRPMPVRRFHKSRDINQNQNACALSGCLSCATNSGAGKREGFLDGDFIFWFYFVQNKGTLIYNCKQIFAGLINYSSGGKPMRNHPQPQQNDIVSPAAFIINQESQAPPDFQLEPPRSEVGAEQGNKVGVDQAARTNSRQQKKRLAGLRSREKKKKYLEDLEEQVKWLGGEVERYESQISNCKDQLVEAIRTANSHSNEHAFTYSQLEEQATAEDLDLDSINHLLDIIQSRIGANASERQTKLDYYFKQITNSLFPAMHRYLMYCATTDADLFAENVTETQLQQPDQKRWTQELFAKIKLDQTQLKGQQKYKEVFKLKRQESIECIRKLRLIRDEMKRQEEVFQRAISEFRLDLNPVQSALMAVFGQKNKFRREFCLGEQLQFEGSPRKQLKLEQ